MRVVLLSGEIEEKRPTPLCPPHRYTWFTRINGVPFPPQCTNCGITKKGGK